MHIVDCLIIFAILSFTRYRQEFEQFCSKTRFIDIQSVPCGTLGSGNKRGGVSGYPRARVVNQGHECLMTRVANRPPPPSLSVFLTELHP